MKHWFIAVAFVFLGIWLLTSCAGTNLPPPEGPEGPLSDSQRYYPPYSARYYPADPECGGYMCDNDAYFVPPYEYKDDNAEIIYSPYYELYIHE